MDILNALGLFSIGTISIAGAIVFISKTVITKVFDGIFESYKISLSKEIEKFKMDLQKEYYKYNVTISKLHLDRAEVIKNLYSKIVDLENELVAFNHHAIKDRTVDSIPDGLRSAVLDFLSYSSHNRIFFDDDISCNLDEIEGIATILSSYALDVYDDEITSITDEHLEFMQELVVKDLPEFRDKLEKQFKYILGVNIK